MSARSSFLKVFQLRRWEYYADFFITPPITAVLMVISLRNASLLWPVWFGAGLLAWTLYEYLTHRFVSHELWIFREAHFLHHRRQTDYIALPPLATVALYALLWFTFGLNSSAFAVGFSVGYVAYSALHTLFHYVRLEGTPLYVLRLNHAAHHRHGNICFGVTTSLWDHVFSTYLPTPR